jgi:putative transposase
MQEEELQVQVKRYVRTTYSARGLAPYPNRLKQRTPSQPNQIWCGDITYIRLPSEWVYLAVRCSFGFT